MCLNVCLGYLCAINDILKVALPVESVMILPFHCLHNLLLYKMYVQNGGRFMLYTHSQPLQSLLSPHSLQSLLSPHSLQFLLSFILSRFHITSYLQKVIKHKRSTNALIITYSLAYCSHSEARWLAINCTIW
jgi:hypothetical protein